MAPSISCNAQDLSKYFLNEGYGSELITIIIII